MHSCFLSTSGMSDTHHAQGRVACGQKEISQMHAAACRSFLSSFENFELPVAQDKPCARKALVIE